VQHFFPSKDQLLTATLEHVLGEIRREYEHLQEALPFNAKARLLGVIDVLVADAWRQDSRRFFLGLHALSCRNAFAERLVSAMCKHHQHRLAGFIGAAAAHLDERQCLDLALQLCAMLDGLTFYTGPGCKTIVSRARLAESIKANVLLLIGAPRAAGASAEKSE
jgi:AcrR family transcriptional regulator